MRKYLTGFMLVVIVFSGTFAKRVAPPKVAPVTKDGITYTATGTGTEGYVVARETNTGNELWRVRVFRVYINPFIEEDNQWIYVSGMKLSDKTLLIQSEAGRCYRLDLTKKLVRKDKSTEYLSTKP